MTEAVELADLPPQRARTGVPNPAKIIFINRFFHPDHSATSQMLSDLAFDLAAEGVAVEVITSRLGYDDPGRALTLRERVRGVYVHRVWSSHFGRAGLCGRTLDYLTFFLSAAWVLWRRADRGSVVVAKTDPPLLSLLVAPVTKFRGARLINWIQDLFPEVAAELGIRIARGWPLAVLRRARNLALRAAHTNVVLGERMAERVMAEAVPRSRIRIIPNWADGQQIHPVPRTLNPLRDLWDLQGKFVVGYSGNLGRVHEFETFLDAAEALEGHRDVVMLFIGNGAQRGAVEASVRRRGLDNVRFQEYQDRARLHESLSVADVHLVSLNPALEGLVFPSKLYGIFAVGRPTLFVGDVDGEIARILREAACGWAVGVGRGRELAAAIRKIAQEASLREAMGRNARRLLEQRYDRKRAVAAWKDVLFEAVP